MASTSGSSIIKASFFLNLNYRSKAGRKKTRSDDDICQVCGHQSVGLNFGVQSCSPCKAFFRRNVVKLGTHEFICLGDGDCPVTGGTRRQCNCCRLAKYFRIGMNPKAIRTDDQRLKRNQLVEYNRQQRANRKTEMIRPTNLLKYNYSSLSFNDQTLLTNIFGAYDQTCVALRYRQNLNTINEDTLSLAKFMNSCAHMYMALIQYFKFVPEFTNLSIYSKKCLLKSNLNQIFRLNNALVVQATGIADNPNSFAFTRLFPPDLYLELCKCIIALFPFVYDPILLKLIHIVLMFSTHMNTQYATDQADDDDGGDYSTLNIFIIQNIYVELLWRYVLYRSSNYRQAVQLLCSFVTRLLHSQFINTQLNEFVSKISPNQTNQLEPIMKTMWITEQK